MKTTPGQNGKQIESPRTIPTYRTDIPFLLALGLVSAFYLVLIAGMLAAMTMYVEIPVLGEIFTTPRYRFAVLLSVISCSITTVLSVWVAVPTAYILNRVNFPGKRFLDVVLDIPIVLPPLVIGLALAARPDVLLLDEPLSSLDEETHAGAMKLLRDVHADTGVTVLHITHNRGEARRLAQRLFALKKGEIAEEDEGAGR